MELTAYQAAPWLIAAASLVYTLLKDGRNNTQATENRIRTLEIDRVTDRMQHAHQLELMQHQLVAAQAAVQQTRNLITNALENANR